MTVAQTIEGVTYARIEHVVLRDMKMFDPLRRLKKFLEPNESRVNKERTKYSRNSDEMIYIPG